MSRKIGALWLKETMRAYLKALRDSGLNVLFIAHVDPVKDEERTLLWPLLETKLREELVNMMDVVGYMTVVRSEEGEPKRVILVDPDTGKFKAKDRTGQLGRYVEPDFTKIIAACNGTASFAWMKEGAVTSKEPTETQEKRNEPTEETNEKKERAKTTKEKASENLKNLNNKK